MATEEQIRNCPHRLWEKAGRPEGRDPEFWHAADVDSSRARGTISDADTGLPHRTLRQRMKAKAGLSSYVALLRYEASAGQQDACAAARPFHRAVQLLDELFALYVGASSPSSKL